MQSTELMHPYSGTIACGPCLPKRSWTRCVAHCEISCFQSWVLFENEGRISTMKPMTPINTWSLFGMWRRRCRRNYPKTTKSRESLRERSLYASNGWWKLWWGVSRRRDGGGKGGRVGVEVG